MIALVSGAVIGFTTGFALLTLAAIAAGITNRIDRKRQAMIDPEASR